MYDDSADFGDVLIDVTGLSLHDLDWITGSALSPAGAPVAAGGPQVSAFSSAI
jgi:hypothetical protein